MNKNNNKMEPQETWKNFLVKRLVNVCKFYIYITDSFHSLVQ
jgi:hypothetical protein